MAVRLPRIPGAVGAGGEGAPLAAEAGAAAAARRPGTAREGGTRRGLPLALVRLPVARRRGRDRRAHRRSGPGGDGSGAIRRRPAAHRPLGRAVPGRTQLLPRRAAGRAGRRNPRRDLLPDGDALDAGAATAAWEAALRAPAWEGPPVWVHGDLQPANLLAVRGRLERRHRLRGPGRGRPRLRPDGRVELLSGRGPRAYSARRCGSTTRPGRAGRGWALSVAPDRPPLLQGHQPHARRHLPAHDLDEVLTDRDT